MAHHSSTQNPLPPSPVIDLRSTLNEPCSPSESLDIKNSPWFTREETRIPLVPVAKKNPGLKPLLQGTTLLRKYIVDDNPNTENEAFSLISLNTGPEGLKQSIVKNMQSAKPQKTVAIADELRDNSPSLSTDSKVNQTIPILAKETPKAKRRFLDKFKNLLSKKKKQVAPPLRKIQTKDLSLEPQFEQLKFLNCNLNAWESDQERLSRLRARHRKSLKGLMVRKRKSAMKRMPTNSLLSSWNAMKMSMIQNIKRNKLVLLPDGRPRISWDMLGMLFILYEVIMIPIKISFTFDDSGFISALELLIDIFFIVDILLTFNTGYYFRGNLVIARRKIALNYLHTWFAFDLIASIPYTRIISAFDGIDDSGSSWLGQSARIIRVLRFFRFIRVLRLIRVFKLQSIFGKLESFISLSPTLNTIVGFLRLSAIILFIAHWIACFWHLIGDLENSDVPDTWITRQQLQDASWSSKYLTSIYWAVTTMITVGYGDIFPVTDSEKIYTLFAMLVASVVFAYSMNSISALLRSLDIENEEYKKTIVWVQRYMKQMKLDRETRMKVKKYLEYTMNEVTFRKDDETKLLGLLSDSLKDELIKKINKGALENCQPLEKLLKKTFSERFITEMIYFLQERIYSPSETIFTEENDSECSIYMVSMGMIEITLFACNELVLETLRKGEHFGELEFFTGMKRQWGARASGEFVSLFYLKRRDLLDLLDSFQTEKERFFQTKDKIALYGDYMGIELKCCLCKGTGHSAMRCPMMHYVVDKEKYLQEQIKEMYKFRGCFIRRNRRKWKHRNDRLLEPSAVRIRENLSSFIEAAENEANEPRNANVTSFGDDLTRRHDHTPTSGAGGHRKSFMGFKSITESLDGEDSHHELQPRERYNRGVKAVKNQPKKQNKATVFETGFDAVCSYRDYFEHNNVDKVIERINEKIRKEKKMRRMKAIRKVIAFTSIRKKLGANKVALPKTPAAAHDYGVGKIKFLSANSKYEETLYDDSNKEVGQSKIGSPIHEEEHDSGNNDGEDAGVKIAEEGVRFNKRFNQESKEFNHHIEFKLMNDIKPNENFGFDLAFMNADSPMIRVNVVEDQKEAAVKSPSFSDNENYSGMSQGEVNRLLQHVIDKYGPDYVKKVINETEKKGL